MIDHESILDESALSVSLCVTHCLSPLVQGEQGGLGGHGGLAGHDGLGGHCGHDGLGGHCGLGGHGGHG